MATQRTSTGYEAAAWLTEAGSGRDCPPVGGSTETLLSGVKNAGSRYSYR